MTTATVVKLRVIPKPFRYCPTSPNLPKVNSRAMPAAEGGRTMGNSTRVFNALLPLKVPLAST
jgi:hypothetical protein